MSTGLIVSLMQGAIKEVLVLVVPVLTLALIVGLIVAIFQATTSIQEQTFRQGRSIRVDEKRQRRIVRSRRGVRVYSNG